MRLNCRVLVLVFFLLFRCFVKGETHDSTRVMELNDKSWEYSSYDFNKATKLANEAIVISEKIGYTKGIATAYNRIGLAFDYKGDYQNAFEYYNRALEIFEQIKDSSEIATTFNNIGTSFYCQANYVDAHDYYLKSLSIREKIDDLKGIAQSHNNIGLIFRVQKKYEKAIESYGRSISIRKKINDEEGIMYAEQNIGVAFEKITQYDSALIHYSNALSIAEKLKDSLTMASNLINKSMANKFLGNFEIAIQQATTAEQILRKISNQHTLAYSLASIGELYLEMKQYGKALYYELESLELAQILGRKDLEQSCCKVISKIYEETDEYKKALEYHQLYSSIKDSIISEKTNNQLNELQTKYETVKKEQQISNLKEEKLIESQRKSLYFGIAASLLFLVIIIILLLRQNKLKAKEHAIMLQQKMLRSQMNPHFIFNALGSIQTYIFNNKPEKAIYYLSNFSTLMRDILEASVHEFIPIQQDSNIIKNYLLLQQLRYEDKFNYEITVNGDTENLQIPPMLTQPFIENAVKHGVGEMEIGGIIQVVYNIDNENVVVKITDNGKGINSTVQKDRNHRSYAISLTKQRLDLVGKDCNVEIASPVFENNTGTKVTITIAKQICINELYE